MRPWTLAGFIAATIVGVAAGLSLGSLMGSSGGVSSTVYMVTTELTASGDVEECTSASGIHSIALPYRRTTGIDDAQDLIDDIAAEGGVALNVQRYDEATDTWIVYPDGSGTSPFSLVPGEALLVQMDTGTDYRMMGGHDPSVVLTLEGASSSASASGLNFIALPYPSTATNAQDLADDIGATDVENVQRYNTATDLWEIYEPGSGATPFEIVAGEGYLVKMINDVSYTPSYYR